MKSIRSYMVYLFLLAMLVVPYRAFAFIGLDVVWDTGGRHRQEHWHIKEPRRMTRSTSKTT